LSAFGYLLGSAFVRNLTDWTVLPFFIGQQKAAEVSARKYPYGGELAAQVFAGWRWAPDDR
jgi:hypothetical protein